VDRRVYDFRRATASTGIGFVTAAWDSVLVSLTSKLGSPEVEKWIRPLRPVALTPTSLRLRAPSRVFITCVSDNYLVALRQSVTEVFGARQILFEVDDAIQGELFPTAPAPRVTPERPQATIGVLVPKYTFATFVVGANNQFAHATARAVAKQPGEQYNPLFVYGRAGLGKTHLVNAIAHSLLESNPEIRLAYLPAEAFVTELIGAIRRERMEYFQRRFRQVDVLIVDDVQFLAGRERSQEEFFHTFNTLYDRHRQIVLTSDTFPKDIVDLAERLRNRFEWGLIADIQPPDLETRIAILGKKAEAEGIVLPTDVAAFIATRVDSNVRELEGSLTRLGAHASLHRTAITLDLAGQVLNHLLSRSEQSISFETIQRIVCEHFSVRPSDLRSKRRTRNVVLPRQLAMYLCRKLLESSFPSIGALFGGRDHSTVIHAIAVIERRMNKDQGFQATVEGIERAVQTASGARERLTRVGM
jgi:chromosomal replication initiator protein